MWRGPSLSDEYRLLTVVPAQAGTHDHRPLEYGSPLSRGRPEKQICVN
jgi:hypothetical protein